MRYTALYVHGKYIVNIIQLTVRHYLWNKSFFMRDFANSALLPVNRKFSI